MYWQNEIIKCLDNFKTKVTKVQPNRGKLVNDHMIESAEFLAFDLTQMLNAIYDAKTARNADLTSVLKRHSKGRLAYFAGRLNNYFNSIDSIFGRDSFSLVFKEAFQPLALSLHTLLAALTLATRAAALPSQITPAPAELVRETHTSSNTIPPTAAPTILNAEEDKEEQHESEPDIDLLTLEANEDNEVIPDPTELKREDSMNQPLDPFAHFELPDLTKLEDVDEKNSLVSIDENRPIFRPTGLPSMLNRHFDDEEKGEISPSNKHSSTVLMRTALMPSNSSPPAEPNDFLPDPRPLTQAAIPTELESVQLIPRTLSAEDQAFLKIPKNLLDLMEIAPLQTNDLSKLTETKEHPCYYKRFAIPALLPWERTLNDLVQFMKDYSKHENAREDVAAGLKGNFTPYQTAQGLLFHCALSFKGKYLAEATGPNKARAKNAAASDCITNLINALLNISFADAIELSTKYKMALAERAPPIYRAI